MEYQIHFKLLGSGGINYQRLRQTSLLWTYADFPTGFFCSNTQATRFVFDWNPGSKEHRKTVTVGESNFLIGAESTESLEQLESQLLKNSGLLAGVLVRLLQNDWSYMRIKSEWHFGKGDRMILQYSGFPADAYENPAALEPYLNDMLAFSNTLGIELERHSTDQAARS